MDEALGLAVLAQLAKAPHGYATRRALAMALQLSRLEVRRVIGVLVMQGDVGVRAQSWLGTWIFGGYVYITSHGLRRLGSIEP